MSDIKIGKINRIDIITQDFNDKEIKTMAGFIRSVDNRFFNGVVTNMEGDNNSVMRSMNNNIGKSYFIKGSLVNGELKFSLLRHHYLPRDYKLVREGINVFYGLSFKTTFYVCQSNDKRIMSSEFFAETAAKASVNSLDDEKEEKVMTSLLIKCINDWHNLIPFETEEKQLLKLMDDEKSSTLLDAFTARGASISKKIFSKR